MERYNKVIQDKDLKDFAEHINQNAFGNPIILGAVPGAGEMKANSWGVFNSKLYVKTADGVLLRFDGTVIP